MNVTADRTPCGISIAAGTPVVVVALLVAARLPDTRTEWRCVVAAVGLLIVAAGTLDLLAITALLPVTGLLVNGFLINRLGTLSWHGRTDLLCLATLFAGALAGIALGYARRLITGHRPGDLDDYSDVPPLA